MTKKYIAVHDRRLAGSVPDRPHMPVVHVDQRTPLAHIFRAINSAAKTPGGIHSLFILCHGFAGVNQRARVCMDAGGMGLQLARENVLHTNVSSWDAIQGKVQNIVVYSCAASNTEPSNAGTTADGQYLMGALAIHTRATVYAADRIQWYIGATNGHVDFGAWEGRLWQFTPDGTPPKLVLGPPVEVEDVMEGKAP